MYQVESYLRVRRAVMVEGMPTDECLYRATRPILKEPLLSHSSRGQADCQSTTTAYPEATNQAARKPDPEILHQKNSLGATSKQRQPQPSDNVP